MLEKRDTLPRFAYLGLLIFSCCAAAQPSTPVVLISVDTLRADRLGCYHAHKRLTPNIDALAGSGTLFTQVSALVPLTLPSHVALLTSTYPFVNGVQDNGVPLGPAVATLATVLKNHGYRTAAFIGGFPLDRRFGLSRGFDVYDSPFDLHNKTATDVGDLKRSGGKVAAAAIRWLEHNSNAPFFVFLHLYDLHTPYDLPGDPRLRRGETGYEAELAYVDRVIGEFVRFLDQRQILKKALVVFTSDHGEGLNDHGETTHGYFVYQSTLRVPLIIRRPAGAAPFPQVSTDEPASLLDVAPTILDAIGIPPTPGMQGRSLAHARGAEEIYSESLYARKHFDCAALRSLRMGRYKYIDAPKPELYDLASDPGETANLYARQPHKAKTLREHLMALLAASPSKGRDPSQTHAPETLAALRSLGYLGGSSNSSAVGSQVDPKDRIADFEQFGQALGLASAGRLAESNSLLEKLRDKLPKITEIRVSLGLNEQRLGRYAEAAREFKQALDQAPLNAQAHFDLGLCYFRLQQPAEAIKELQAALALEPWYTRAEELLADIYIHQGSYSQARACMNHLLSIDPDNYTAHYNLGVLAARGKSWSEAEKHIASAIQTDPGSAEAHNTMGSIYVQRGTLEPAQHEFEHAIKLQPKFAWAHYNLALVFQKQGRDPEAAQELQAALQADPGFMAARAALERIKASNK
ncbi:MAG TPA: sulfatase-like hydrolase/transferase [Bryobacteraceae bacterium]|nr:sulfatase-like hydrolase/transferase [Bryobacteraceae bacterium]